MLVINYINQHQSITTRTRMLIRFNIEFSSQWLILSSNTTSLVKEE